MKAALGIVLLAGASALALLAPPLWLIGLLVASLLLARTGRTTLIVFSLVSLLLNVLLLGFFVPGDGLHWSLGPVLFGAEGALRGAVAGLRLSTVVTGNLAVLAWIPPPVLIDGLRLPARATAFLGAVALAGHALVQDAGRLRDARRLEGTAARNRLGRAREAGSLLAPMMVLAHDRARTRRDALRAAGIDMGRSFTPLVAVTALAAAGRLAMAAVPNVSLTYAFVFAGGMVYGARVGALGGLLSMAFTDFLLSGLNPTAYVNAPTMALVGLAGAALRRVPFSGHGADRVAGLLLAGVVGVLATLMWSVATDTLTWLLVPEFRGSTRLLAVQVTAGLAFNVLPAAANGILFAALIGPVQRIFGIVQGSEARVHGAPAPRNV